MPDDATGYQRSPLDPGAWRNLSRGECTFFAVGFLGSASMAVASLIQGSMHDFLVGAGSLSGLYTLFLNPDFLRDDVRSPTVDTADLEGLEYGWLGVSLVAMAALLF